MISLLPPPTWQLRHDVIHTRTNISFSIREMAGVAYSVVLPPTVLRYCCLAQKHFPLAACNFCCSSPIMKTRKVVVLN
jgi:hypothetical protein